MAGPSVQNGANGAKAIGNQETNHLMQDIQFPMHSNSHGVYIGNSFNIGNSSMVATRALTVNVPMIGIQMYIGRMAGLSLVGEKHCLAFLCCEFYLLCISLHCP